MWHICCSFCNVDAFGTGRLEMNDMTVDFRVGLVGSRGRESMVRSRRCVHG